MRSIMVGQGVLLGTRRPQVLQGLFTAAVVLDHGAHVVSQRPQSTHSSCALRSCCGLVACCCGGCRVRSLQQLRWTTAHMELVTAKLRHSPQRPWQ